jgi:hypothetical protein
VLDKTNASQFQNLLDAVRLREQGLIAANDALWTIGDALIAICGSPGPNGPNDRSHKVMCDIAHELAQCGFKGYQLVTLRLLRRVAASFAADKRLTGVTWSHHMAAGDRQTLDHARREAERRAAKFTVEFIKAFIEARGRKNHDTGAAQRARDHTVKKVADVIDALYRLDPHLPNLTYDEEFDDLLDRAVARISSTKTAIRPSFREAAE